MKKLLKIAIILAISGIIVAALVWKFYINKSHEDIDAAKPAFSIAAVDLWAQYNDNLQKADSLYTGKVIEISGILSRIENNDSLVSLIFVMDADSMFGDKTIRCQAYPKHNMEASVLKPGSRVKIKGFCTGYNDTDIQLNKCSVIK